MIHTRHAALMVLAAATLGLCACADFPGTTNNSAVTFTQSGYSAADALIQQARGSLTPDTIIKAGVLTDINNPAAVSTLGRVLTAQVGARFVQMGYNVGSASFDETMALRQQSSQSSPYGSNRSANGGPTSGPVLIAGQYAMAHKSVLVGLRLIDIPTGRVLSAYDYDLPMTSDVRELAKTKIPPNAVIGF